LPDVRRFVETDVDQVRRFLRLCWLDTYKGILPDSTINKVLNTWQSPGSILAAIRRASLFFAGYFEDGEIVGLVNAGKRDESTLVIFQIYVHPSHQRKGIGSKLLQQALDRFPEVLKVVLDVEVGNKKGISFYEKHGFKQVGREAIDVEGERIPCIVEELIR